MCGVGGVRKDMIDSMSVGWVGVGGDICGDEGVEGQVMHPT